MKFFPIAAAVAVSAIAATGVIVYIYSGTNSKCSKTEAYLIKSVNETTTSVQKIQASVNELIAGIQATFVSAGFTAPESFIHLEDDIDKTDQAWHNCMDSLWTMDAFPIYTARAPPVYNLKDANTWERYLRSKYCEDVRNSEFFEMVFDAPPPFENDPSEPKECMTTKNVINL
jgi:hypothetical protein